MLLIDVLVIGGVVGVFVIGFLGARAARRKAKPEIQGEENAEEDAQEIYRQCYFCRKPTDVRTDLFINGHWYHKLCYRNKDGNKKV